MYYRLIFFGDLQLIDHVELVKVMAPEGVWVMFVYDCGATDKFEFYDQGDIDFVVSSVMDAKPADELLVNLRDRMRITVH